MVDESFSAHYDKYVWMVGITKQDAERGYKELRIDPYRVEKICNITDPALAQCNKKAMRGTDKGHDLRTVYKEIISAAQRGLDMLDEDEA